jgi:transmembrane sensor
LPPPAAGSYGSSLFRSEVLMELRRQTRAESFLHNNPLCIKFTGSNYTTMTSGELYNLAARHFSGEATAEEQQALNQWIHSSETSKNEFEAMKQLWETEPASENPAWNIDAAWQKVVLAIENPQQKNTPATEEAPVKMLRPRWGRYAAAAGVLLLLSIGFIFRNTLFGSNNTITVLADAHQVIRLDDGSSVHLHKGAQFTYPRHFAASQRSVQLKGEAFFEIARNEASPFIISAANTEVKVLGTSFNVNTFDGNKVSVMVATGKVRFSAKGGAVELTPGETGLFANGQISEAPTTNANAMAWHTGLLQFTNTALPDVLSTISSQYGISIAIAAEARPIADTSRITAQFSNETAAEILGDLELLLPAFRFKPSGDSAYTLSNR